MRPSLFGLFGLLACAPEDPGPPTPVYLSCDRPNDGLCVEFVGAGWVDDDARTHCQGEPLVDEACSSERRIGICHLDDGGEAAVDWHYYRTYYGISGLELGEIWDRCEADDGVWQTTI